MIQKSKLSLKDDFLPFHPPLTNLVGQLRYWSAEQPDNPAFYYLSDGDENEVGLNYRELDRRARAIAAHLVDQGLAGERLLLLYPPGLEFVEAFFGCLYAGAVAVPAFPPRRNRNMERIELIAAAASSKAALTVQDVKDRAGAIVQDSPALRELPWIATDLIDSDESDAWLAPELHEKSLAVLQYTSGSTGNPKGVMLTHSNLMENCAMITHAFEFTRNGVGMSWLPAYHDMGLVGGILNPLFYGRPSVLMSPLAFLQRPVRWLRAISKYRVTISGGPNFAYERCVEKISAEEMQGLDLSSWEVAFCGAEPVRPETLEKFTRKFECVGFRPEACYPCYGMAETTLLVTGGYKGARPVLQSFDGRQLDKRRVVATACDAPGARCLTGCGRVLPGEEVATVDPDTHERLPADKIGEIWINSPSVGVGYFNNKEATENVFHAGIAGEPERFFLRTGDLGFLHDGELFVTGRLKDMIIVRGVNRYPQDIEHTVQGCDSRLAADGAAAFSIEKDGQERLIIVSEVERTRSKDWTNAIETIRLNVANEHELPPEAVVLVRLGSIPKTSSGKIQRHGCRQAFLEGALKEVASWSAWETTEREAMPTHNTERAAAAAAESGVNPAVLQVVLDAVRTIAKERAKNLTIDSNVVELGLDSLERLEIISCIEDIYGGRIPAEVLPTIETCGEVAIAVEKHLGVIPQPTESTPLEEITEEWYRFEKMPEHQQLQATKALLLSTGVENPYFTVHEGITADTTQIGGRELISFASYNYIGMSGDPRVIQAAQDATQKYGASVSASRLVSGEKPVHGELERAIAKFLGTQSAIVFNSGHSTNETVIGHLFGPGDLILHDALAHNSIVQGSILSGARRRPFPHNDFQTLEKLLAELRGKYRRVLIAIEGVYSMDGDFPNLPRFVELKDRYKAMLMVDEAHSVGTMGAHGRGLSEYFHIDPASVEIWMGTISKALGSCGGYIAGCNALIEYLKYTAPSFVFSGGLSPPNAAAGLAALRLLEEEPQRVARLQERSAFFVAQARAKGLNTGFSSGTPVVPIILGDSLAALRLSRAMFENGVNVQPILHPAVEESAARLRFFITCKHSEEQIRYAIDLLAKSMREIRPDLLTDAAAPKQLS